MKSKGFTLIELLVGIVIISIVFSIGYAGFRDFSRRQALTGVSGALMADLRLAQQLALTGQKPLGLTCLRLVGYRFTRVSTSNYKLYATCDNNGAIADAVPEIKSVNLPAGVTLSASTNSILFKILGQGTDLLATNDLILRSGASTIAAQITIGTGGNVIIGSTSVPAPTASPVPTASPSPAPTATPTPTAAPTAAPTSVPTAAPTPTRTPTPAPTSPPK